MAYDLLSTLRPLANLMSGRSSARKLQILIYHRVLDRFDPLRPDEPTLEQFEWQMALMAAHFNVLPLSTAVKLLEAGNLPPRAACITFDDGYLDNLTLAAPILQRFNLPATVFVATGFLDGGIMFNDIIKESIRQYSGSEIDLGDIGLEGKFSTTTPDDQYNAVLQIIRQLKYLPGDARMEKAHQLAAFASASLPTDLMLDSSALPSILEAGMEVGAHTVSHPILESLDDKDALAEIKKSKNYLSQVLNKPINLFAYPNGRPGTDYSARHASMVRDAGFTAAVSTSKGCSTRASSIFELHRFTPWDRDRHKFFIRLLSNYA